MTHPTTTRVPHPTKSWVPHLRGGLIAAKVGWTTTALLLLAFSPPAHAQRTCNNIPNPDHPKATLTNGTTTAVVFLPDPVHGYYRAARFDWSGVVACLAYNGHTFWGEWSPHYDPLRNDAITGPVEEFRSDEGALGYTAAKPGGPFVKIGVGTLRRLADTPYSFGAPYPLIDGGRWTTRVHAHSIVFQQRLTSPLGIAYLYTKTLALDPKLPVLTLTHSLKNLGRAPIVTDVYDHDFFMLDNRPTGPGIVLRFPFAPVPDKPLDPALATIDGNTIRYTADLPARATVAAYLTGYGPTPASYDITLEDTSAGISVHQTADAPIAKLYLWSIRSTICPEAYLHLDIPPGQTQRWTIRYQFAARESK